MLATVDHCNRHIVVKQKLNISKDYLISNVADGTSGTKLRCSTRRGNRLSLLQRTWRHRGVWVILIGNKSL